MSAEIAGKATGGILEEIKENQTKLFFKSFLEKIQI